MDPLAPQVDYRTSRLLAEAGQRRLERTLTAPVGQTVAPSRPRRAAHRWSVVAAAAAATVLLLIEVGGTFPARAGVLETTDVSIVGRL